MEIKLGIIKDFKNRHKYYVEACKELSVPYEMVDISGSDWIDVVKQSDCDGFLVRPSVKFSVWKQMFDERLKIIVEELGKEIYPAYHELWMFESKCRMHYWLEANSVPCPKTWVFYELKEALDFADKATLPIVFKSDLGSASSGVKIFRWRLPLKLFIRKCFKRGFVRKKGDRRDRQWGRVFLQEYLPDVLEWRMIRLGDSFFGHQKVKEGDFHSGSCKVDWATPPKVLLDYVRDVTDAGRFTSMALDIFETRDGQYLVNELQTIYGSYNPSQMYVDGKPGRYRYDQIRSKWVFEDGYFCQNASCNLRVITFLEQLDRKNQL